MGIADGAGVIGGVSVIAGGAAAEALGKLLADGMGEGSAESMAAIAVDDDEPTANVGVGMVPNIASKINPASRIAMMPAVATNTYRLDFGGMGVKSLEPMVRTESKDAESGPFCTRGSASLFSVYAGGGIDNW